VLLQTQNPTARAGRNEMPDPRRRTTGIPIYPASRVCHVRSDAATRNSVRSCVLLVAGVGLGHRAAIPPCCSDKTVSTITFPQMPGAAHSVHHLTKMMAAALHKTHPLQIDVW